MNDYERQEELIKREVTIGIPAEVIEWLDDDAIRRIYGMWKAHEAQMCYANSLEIMEQLPKGSYVRWMPQQHYFCRVLEADGGNTEYGEVGGVGETRAEAIIDAVMCLIAAKTLADARESAIEPLEGPDEAI